MAIEDTEVVYEPGEQIATLSGMLLDGQSFEGSDSIWVFTNGSHVQAVPEPSGIALVVLAYGFLVTAFRRTSRA